MLIVAGAVVLAGCSSPSSPPAATTAPPAAAAPSAPTADAAPPPAAAAAPTTALGAPAAPSSQAAPARPATAPTAPTAPASTATPAPPVASAPPVAAPPAPTAAAPPAAPPAPTFLEVTVPSGTTLAIELKSAHASNTSTVEEPVRGTLRRALVVNGVEVAPAGADVSGSVTAVERSGRVKGRARLALRFTSLTVEGAAEPISTAAIAREAEGTKGEDAAKIGIGAGAGAVIGAIAGGKKGAVVGGTVGGAAGTGVVLATRGDEVTLASGTALSTTLTRPLVVQIRQR